MTVGKVAAATATLFLTAQPCVAAELERHSPREQRSARFAGMNLTMPFGPKKGRPTARLQLSSIQYARGQSGAFVQTSRTPGLEFGATNAGKPTFFLAGQDTAEMQNKLNLGGNNTLLVVGGVVVVVLVLAAVASALPTAGPREGAFD